MGHMKVHIATQNQEQQNQWTRRTKSSRGPDNDALSFDLLGKIDLVARGVLSQDLEVRDRVAFLDEGRRGVVEEGSLGPGGRNAGCETAGSEHGSGEGIGRKRHKQAITGQLAGKRV